MNRKITYSISEQTEANNCFKVTLHIGSYEEELRCFMCQGFLQLINSKGIKRKASLYIPFSKQILVLKREQEEILEINQTKITEFYDADSNLIIVNKDNEIIYENAYGFKYIDEETLVIFLSKPTKFIIDNSTAKKVGFDESICGIVIKANKPTRYEVWKEFNDTYLFFADHEIYIYVEKEFHQLLGDVFIWTNNNCELALFTIEKDRITLYSNKFEILLFEYNSKRIHKDNIKFVTNDYIVFYDKTGILVINRDGEICWDDYTSFCPQGINDTILWEFKQSNSPYKISYHSGDILFYDVFGNLVLSDTWIGYGEGGMYRHFSIGRGYDCGFSDYALFKIDRSKHTTNIYGKPAKGVIGILQKKVVLPAIFDEITIVEYYGLAKYQSSIDKIDERKSFFIVKIDGGSNPMYGCFDDEKTLFPIGLYDKIEALQYLDKWNEKRYGRDEYGIEREHIDIHEGESYSGWLVLHKHKTISLAYHGIIVYSDPQINTCFHLENSSLYLNVQVGSFWGVLSPDGWAIPPLFNVIVRITPKSIENFRGSARRFYKNIFLVDGGMIYSTGVNKDIKTGENRIVTTCVFDPKDEYQYSHSAPYSFGNDYFYLNKRNGKMARIRIEGNSIVHEIEDI